ncbi:hypothetical protein [Pendulispora albinea]|uniref:Uncharacterized protein n=1 Tax=Pendulispora albinea TaxID=2741071 RepID=A0ABZ2LYD1_9BACT
MSMVSSFRTIPFALSLSVMLALAAGCSSESNPPPNNPPASLTLQGTATGEKPADSGEPVATLVWSKGGGQILATRSTARAAIDAAPPRKFTLPVNDPPPAEVIDSAGLAFAFIAAVRPDKTPVDASEMAAAIVGGSEEFILVYSAHNIAPDSFSGKLFRGAVEAGYHLYKVRKFTEQERSEISACKQTATSQGKDPKVECPAFKQHVSPAPNGFSEQILIKLPKPSFPDFS